MSLQISLKNKDAEEKFWKLQQTLSSPPTKVSVPGELTSHRLVELERDSFYELTVEAVLAGAVVCSAKRIFRTDDKGSCLWCLGQGFHDKRTEASFWFIGQECLWNRRQKLFSGVLTKKVFRMQDRS